MELSWCLARHHAIVSSALVSLVEDSQLPCRYQMVWWSPRHFLVPGAEHRNNCSDGCVLRRLESHHSWPTMHMSPEAGIISND